MVDSSTPPATDQVSDRVHSVAEAFARQVVARPDEVAFTAKGASITVSELDRLSNRVAHSLPLSADRRPVAIACGDEIDCQAAVLGVLKAGRPVVVLSTVDPPLRRLLVLDGSEADTIITSVAAEGAEFDNSRAIVTTNELSDDDGAVDVGIREDDVAMINFTSGSTGRPKGILHTVRSLMHGTEAYVDMLGLVPEDRLVLFSRTSSLDVVAGMVAGLSLHSFDLRSTGFSGLPAWMADQEVSVLRLTPSILRAVAPHFDGHRLAHLRLIAVAGERFTPRDLDVTWQAFGRSVPVCHFYGSAEAGLVSSHRISSAFTNDRPRVPVGPVVPGVEVTLVDSRGELVPVGEPGTILVRSPSLADGYLGQPELTAQRFGGVGSERRVNTGDLGVLDHDGRLEYLGRTDDLVKVNGQRVEMGEIENALRGVSGVAEAVVVADEVDGAGTRLVAYYKPDGSRKLDARLLRSALAPTLPAYMIPAVAVAVESFAIGANSKIDRGSLPAVTRGTVSDAGPQDVPSRMARLWRELLGVDRVEPDDSFFAHGGDSLAAAGLMAAVETEFGVMVPMVELFEHDTVAAMCELVEQGHRRRGHLLMVPLKAGGTLPPLYCVHMPGWPGFTYARLARRMPSGRPMTGVIDDLAGDHPPDKSVEATARRYARAIREDSDGPYHLIGTSAAGMIAYEAARQLQDVGATVAFVGLIDTGYPRLQSAHLHWPITVALRRRGLVGTARLALGEARRRLRRRPRTGVAANEAKRLHRLAASITAYRRYVVKDPGGPVVYFRADAGDRFRKRAMAGWSPVVDEIVETPGAHTGSDGVLAEPNVADLAAALEDAIARVATVA